MRPNGVDSASMARTYLAAFAAICAVTAGLWALRSSLGLATMILTYLLVVFLSAVWWGRGPGLTAGLASFLALNYFFTVPYGTFRVASTEDLISLLVFLFVAEMSSRLVARLHEREAEARRRALEASTLYALAHDMNASAQPEEALRKVASRVVAVVGEGRCAIFLPKGRGRLRLHTVAPDGAREVPRTGAAPDSALRAFTTGEPSEDGVGLCLPLRVGDKVVGVLMVEPAQDVARLPETTRRMLGAFAENTAMVIERLRLQREAAEAEVLRRADELKSALLSTVSHDLRTPLSSIRIAATTLLRGDLQSNESARLELLEMIDTEAARLARLVNNLLDLSRIEAGVLKAVKELHDLHEVVARAVDALHSRLREYRVVVDISADLPLVPCDFTQVEDVLVNLLENAVRILLRGRGYGSVLRSGGWRLSSRSRMRVRRFRLRRPARSSAASTALSAIGVVSGWGLRSAGDWSRRTVAGSGSSVPANLAHGSRSRCRLRKPQPRCRRRSRRTSQ